MKKLLLLACLFMGAAHAFAQTVTYGVKGGLNLTRLPAESTIFGASSVTSSYLTGFNIGGVADIGFSSFSIQPGIFYTTKGGKNNVVVDLNFGGQMFSGSAAVKTTLNYLELPVNFIYKVPAASGKVFFGAGPYIGYGLSGKSTIISTVNGQSDTQSQDLKFGSGDDEINRMDYGFNLLAGYELSNGVTLDAGYGQSFASASSTSGKVKNQGFRFSVGYFFK